MKAEELYFLKDNESDGFFLVTREFWEANHCISDNELDSEVYNILPEEFCQEAESYFNYYDGKEDEDGMMVPNAEKGFEILHSLGIQEIRN